MQPTRSKYPYSYLQRILNNGAKPFRYRKGIYSLLGISDSHTKEFSSGLMNFFSMGLPYANFYKKDVYISRQPRKPISDGRFGNTVKDPSSEISGNRDKQSIRSVNQKSEQPYDPVLNLPENQPKRSTVGPDYSQGSKPEEHKNAITENLTPNSPGITEMETRKISPTSESAQYSIESKPYSNIMNIPTPVPADQFRMIDIPGISGKDISFKALAVNKRMDKSNLYFQRLEFENTYLNESEKQANLTPGEEPGSSNTISYKPKQNEDPYNSRNKARERPTQDKKQDNISTIKPVTKKVKTALKCEKIIYNPTNASASPAEILSNPDVHHLLPVQAITREEAAAGNIEQIRRSMQEFYSKEYHNRVKNENKNQDIPTNHQMTQNKQIPAQPVVVIKRGSDQGVMRLAFWERSYLGRYNMMPLR